MICVQSHGEETVLFLLDAELEVLKGALELAIDNHRGIDDSFVLKMENLLDQLEVEA